MPEVIVKLYFTQLEINQLSSSPRGVELNITPYKCIRD